MGQLDGEQPSCELAAEMVAVVAEHVIAAAGELLCQLFHDKMGLLVGGHGLSQVHLADKSVLRTLGIDLEDSRLVGV